MDEFALIRRYFAPLAGEGAFALTDDAACITPPEGTSLVFTKDCLIAGVHFVGDELPALIARKLLRVNLSDLAAKGARPYGYLLGLMLPRTITPEWFAGFAQGLAADQDVFGLALLGGDTTAHDGPLCLSLTAIGTLFSPPLTRAGAQAGDHVYVTGTLGDAALGLKYPQSAALLDRYRLPRPRISIGQALQGIATACMDISDGLLQDAMHLARASGVSVHLEAARIPFSDAARTVCEDPHARLQAAATGGDDYELLFTTPAQAGGRIAAIAAATGVPLTRIGETHTGNGEVTLVADNGSPLTFLHPGWRHFY